MRDGRNTLTTPASDMPATGRATRRGPRGGPSAPASKPAARPTGRPARPKNAGQAQARSKARKAKSPRIVRTPLRQRLRARLIERLAGVDLRPQALLAKVPFVVVVIGSLGIGLGITLWLSTDAAQRSYQLGSARSVNEALAQQKEALEREVLQAESAPALAEAARDLGMIPSRDTAHLVLDPAGNWVVVGQPKPAEGAPPPPLNTTLPEENPAPAKPSAPQPAPGAVEVPVRLMPPMPAPAGVPVGALSVPGPEVPVRVPPGPSDLHAGGAALPGPVPPTAPVPSVPSLVAPVLPDGFAPAAAGAGWTVPPAPVTVPEATG